jgi:hypothetical protein
VNELIKALIRARSEFPPIAKDKTNPAFKGVKYASLDSVLDSVVPTLCRHGLVAVQTLDEGKLITTLYHESGQFIQSSYLLPSGLDAQKMGAAITYGRRYSICSLLCITADEDTDGNGVPGGNGGNSSNGGNGKSVNEIGALIQEIREFLGFDRTWVLDWLSDQGLNSSDLVRVYTKLIADMSIEFAVAQGFDRETSMAAYAANVKEVSLSAIKRWQKALYI